MKKPRKRLVRASHLSDAAFVNGVLDAALQVGDDGRFGPRKVFIVELWSAMEEEMPLDDFKQRLLRAHRAGAVELVRADLAGAMNARQLRESEVRDHHATYHLMIDPNAKDYW